jgi:alkanesulfonate monooxygenase SsuD/methylene tetrahydromethanopterin reductase-like flavin-dependent oxidoreductase (luciferase family)
MVPRLSVLDQSPVGAGFTPADALQSSVELAQAAEELGYVRYWTAEHHGPPGFAGSAPEVLAPATTASDRSVTLLISNVGLPRAGPSSAAAFSPRSTSRAPM